MAYKVIILYQLYMPSYFLGTFTEYPVLFKKRFAEYPCLHRININSFFAIFPDERLYDKLSEL